MALPKPVWTNHDIHVAWEVVRKPSSLIWNTWNEDLTKMAVLRAIVSRQDRFNDYFGSYMVRALTQKWVCSFHSYSLEVEEVNY